MDIFFTDPNDVPRPPEEVRLRELTVAPWPDGRRVRLHLELTPFLQRPDLEITLRDPAGAVAAELSVIELLEPQMDFTLHLRGTVTPGDYRLEAVLGYAPRLPQPAADADPAAPIPLPELPPMTVVDRAERVVTLAAPPSA
jgi:hypothetical protein